MNTHDDDKSLTDTELDGVSGGVARRHVTPQHEPPPPSASPNPPSTSNTPALATPASV